MSLVPASIAPLPVPPELLPILFDYSASFIWALSGALIAARRGFVGIGILTIAIASAVGGGLLRDMLLLSAPVAVRNPVYLTLALIATLMVAVGGRVVDRARAVGPAVYLADALGAGAYAVVGANLAIAADLPQAGVIFVSVVNAVGGGLLRDVLMRRVPDLFKPGVPLGGAAFAGAILFSMLAIQVGVPQTVAAFVTIGTVFVLAGAMLQMGVRSRPLESFREYWEGRE
ncbi:MAG TPA: TRIC cation channel family protein [Allosphingosinicella sp.]|nr:TRIC cation channel family protein [Allosphingosinicella sp.]